MWRPWDTEEKKGTSKQTAADNAVKLNVVKSSVNEKLCYEFYCLLLNTDTHPFVIIDEKRQRVSIGEKEKNFITCAYDKSSGKDWKDVLRYVRENIVDEGLPHHVVNLYLTQTGDERLVNRMRRIIQDRLRQAAATSSSTSVQAKSTNQAATAPLLNNIMKYAKKQTPEERKGESLKRKLDAEFVDSSGSSSSDEGMPSTSHKKTSVKDAHEAHKKMCEKALKTMDNVNDLLGKVDKYLQKNN